MNHRRFDLRVLFFLVCFLLWSPIHAPAGDSTSFSRQNVTAVVTGGAVPVGTVIIWPFSTNPEGWSEGKWLECNGQAVSASVHPELFAVVGANVPDLRGLFLRGTGGNAAALGSIQEDAGRNITGTFPGMENAGGSWASSFTGAFYMSSNGGFPGTNKSDWDNFGAVFDASRSWGVEHTADEFRPRNRSVRYLIRAKS